MKNRFTPFSSEDPLAIRTIDIDQDRQEILIGRHVTSEQPGFGIISRKSLEWRENLDHLVQGTPKFARFTSDQEEIVLIDNRMQAIVVDRKRNESWTVSPTNEQVESIALSAQSSKVVVNGKRTEVWDLHSPRPLWDISSDFQVSYQVDKPIFATLNANGSWCAVNGIEPGMTVIYDMETKGKMLGLEEGPDHAHSMEFHNNDRFLSIIGWRTRGSRIWDLTTGKKVAEDHCNLNQQGYWCQQFHPSLDYIAFGALSGYVAVVDLAQDRFAFAEKLHRGRVWDIRFSTDGATLMTAGDDGFIWSLEWDDIRA